MVWFPELHGQMSQHDVQLVEQALIEISALKPEHQIFLVGTTNYLDRIDPRILRGGRFSEKVLVPIPDERRLSETGGQVSRKGPPRPRPDVRDLAERVAGIAPADLEATIQSMKRVAMRRMDRMPSNSLRLVWAIWMMRSAAFSRDSDPLPTPTQLVLRILESRVCLLCARVSA